MLSFNNHSAKLKRWSNFGNVTRKLSKRVSSPDSLTGSASSLISNNRKRYYWIKVPLEREAFCKLASKECTFTPASERERKQGRDTRALRDRESLNGWQTHERCWAPLNSPPPLYSDHFVLLGILCSRTLATCGQDLSYMFPNPRSLWWTK